MPNHSSLAIANEFLILARKEGQQITHMQLQKLVYLAHGWNLAVNGEKLIEDEIEAWEFGPVIRKLYDALRKYGRGIIKNLICWGDDTDFFNDDGKEALEKLDPSETAVLSKVWETYKGLEAFRLSALTHMQGSPWHLTYESGKNRVIDHSNIWTYFAALATGHELDQNGTKQDHSRSEPDDFNIV